MNWRWLIFDFIPPEFELNRDQRREVRSYIAFSHSDSLWILLCLFTYFLFQFFLLYTFVTILVSGNRSPIGIVSFGLLTTFGPFCLFYTFMFVLHRPRVLRALDLYMHLQGRCEKCGYDLRILEDDDPESANCPECGHPRDLTSQKLRHSTCRACGYDLKGLPDSSTLCPECGNKRL